MFELTAENTNPAVQNNGIRNADFEFNLLTMNMLQKLQIEKYCLNFLLKCRGLKRPPPSLRCTGFKGLEETERIELISSVETDSLRKAIAIKQKKVKVLENSVKLVKDLMPLSNSQQKAWKKRFNKKIAFYKTKEGSDWSIWPRKFETQREKSKRRKYQTQRNMRRKQKEVEKRAANHLKLGDVRVLVDLPIPPEAIAVLGKGPGFVPTPSQDVSELRLDARRATNKIVYFANALGKEATTEQSLVLSEEQVQIDNNIEECPFSVPYKLRTTNYFQSSLHNNDTEMIMAVHHITTQANCFKRCKTGSELKMNLSKLEEKGLQWLQKNGTKFKNMYLSS